MKEKSDIFSIFGFGFAEMNKKSLPSTLSYNSSFIAARPKPISSLKSS